MSRTIVISPVSRIEGHAKITIQLGDDGKVVDARIHATDFRGFEKVCEGRSFEEMPAITSRICGICPVSHQLAAASAGDAILAVDPPPAAVRLRRIVNLAQMIQSHALSFFYFSSPDLLLGFDADPARRNLLGVAAAFPDIARGGIRLRQFGQSVIEAIAGRRIHPTWAVPGGVSAPLTAAARDVIASQLPEALETARATLRWFTRSLKSYRAEAEAFGNFPSLFMGMVTEEGLLEHYGGRLRIVDAAGAIVADQLDPAEYPSVIGEAAEPWSYMKFPYYRPYGYPRGLYRVGPLARLNVAARCGTPAADEALLEFRQAGSGPVLGSFHYHHARLIEMLFCLERMGELLRHPDVLSDEVLVRARPARSHGVGTAEAPRGTLFHRYDVDSNGVVQRVDLLIATGQNNLAMNQTMLQIARAFVEGQGLTEGALNRMEAGIRAFDPCLSCATHASGTMPLIVDLIDSEGRLVDRMSRPT